jgi:hypothetical protein
VIEHFIDGHPVPGWPTVVAGLMFFGGIQLLSIGILGECIGRIFEAVKQRPVYVLMETCGAQAMASSSAERAEPVRVGARRRRGRALVVCADGRSLSAAVDQGILALVQAGRISAVSCLTSIAGPARWQRSGPNGPPCPV